MADDPAGAATVRAERAWRAVVPEGPRGEAILRHGLRVGYLLWDTAGRRDPRAERALAVAAVLHEVGWFLADRGHHAVRGARWVAIHLDEILTDPTDEERVLIGELILFHRHRGPLPHGVAHPDLVDRFRRVERWDREGGPAPDGSDPDSLEAAEGAHPRGLLRRALVRAALAERLRHPILAGRVHRIRRPDR